MASKLTDTELTVGTDGHKITGVDADGKALTTEELAEQARRKRDSRIEDVSWRIERYQTQRDLGIPTTDSAETYTQILQYVQDLRDIPAQGGFPADIIWPTLLA